MGRGGPHVENAQEALRELVERVRPGLVIASGDLAHRGRRSEHDDAAALLRSLALPVLAIPGNHDIPYTFPARFTRPWAEFERHWETTQPLYEGEGAWVVGLNSVRPWRHQSGKVTIEQLEKAVAWLRGAP